MIRLETLIERIWPPSSNLRFWAPVKDTFIKVVHAPVRSPRREIRGRAPSEDSHLCARARRACMSHVFPIQYHIQVVVAGLVVAKEFLSTDFVFYWCWFWPISSMTTSTMTIFMWYPPMSFVQRSPCQQLVERRLCTRHTPIIPLQWGDGGRYGMHMYG